MTERRLTALERDMYHLDRRVADNAAQIKTWAEHNNRIGSRFHVIEVGAAELEKQITTLGSLPARLSAIEECLRSWKRMIRFAILGIKLFAAIVLLLGVLSGKVSQDAGKAAMKIIGGL